MTPNAAKLKTIVDGPANLPVLYVGDPRNGDRFEFGTFEELEREEETLLSECDDDVCVRLIDTHELKTWIDFEVYENDQPILKI